MDFLLLELEMGRLVEREAGDIWESSGGDPNSGCRVFVAWKEK